MLALASLSLVKDLTLRSSHSCLASDVSGVATFEAECLALFSRFWFVYKLFTGFRSDAPQRHIQGRSLNFLVLAYHAG
jgi:hypothetical protein